MARAALDLLYDTTSASGGSLDTGVLSTVRYDQLVGEFSASGGSPTGCQAFVLDPATTGTFLAAAAAATPATTAGLLFCWGIGVGGGTGPLNAPVPPAVRFTIGAIAAQTVRFILWGVRLT